MLYTIISVIICLLITVIYNGIILFKYKLIPQSLSETSYIMGGNNIYIFTVYCTLISFLLCPSLLQVTPDNYQILPFIFCGGLLFSGCSPLFREGLDKIVHYTSAYIAFGVYAVYMVLCMPWYFILSYVLLLGSLCIWKYKSFIYFAENTALFTILIYLLYIIIL